MNFLALKAQLISRMHDAFLRKKFRDGEKVTVIVTIISI
jgi:hypothetical protein